MSKTESEPRTIYIRPSEIFVDGENHCIHSKDEITAMATTLQQSGQLQSILVTDVSDEMKKKADGRKYHLVFGHLRVMAVEYIETIDAAAAPMLRAVYKPGMQMQEIIEHRTIENINRHDMTPIDASKAIAILMARTSDDAIRDSLGLAKDVEITEGHRLTHISRVTGRGLTWINSVAFLVRLNPNAMKALVEGRLEPGDARAIARIADHDEQDRITQLAMTSADGRRFMTHDKIVAEVDAATYIIHPNAPWVPDVKIESLPACDTCEHNSANRPALFNDLSPDKPTCLLKRCFQQKMKISERAITSGIDKVRKIIKTKGEEAPALTATGLADHCPKIIRLPIFVRRAKAWIDAENHDAVTPAAKRAADKTPSADEALAIPWNQRPERVADQAVSVARDKFREAVRLAGAKCIERPLVAIAFNVIANLKAVREVTECYMGEPHQKKLIERKPWRDTMKLVKRIMNGSDKDVIQVLTKAWKEAFSGMSWVDLFERQYGLPKCVNDSLAQAMGITLPDEPDYEAIRLDAHTKQEEKLKSKAEEPKAPQPDAVKRKPRTDKPKKKAKASSGRRGMIKKKR